MKKHTSESRGFWKRLFDAVSIHAGECPAESLRRSLDAGEGGIVVVDVRSIGEFRGPLGHVPGALHAPLAEIETRPDALSEYKNRDLVMSCLTGMRSRKAAAILNARGFRARNLAGGMRRWNRLGYPAER
jgi:rhodanese-related sulfurtransferase